MKTNGRLMAIFLFLIIFIGVFATTAASTTEGSCYLKASKTDVFVIVHNLSRNGDRGYRIWQGRLNQGEKVRIDADHGRLRYYSSIDPEGESPMTGGQDRWCDSNKTIGVP